MAEPASQKYFMNSCLEVVFQSDPPGKKVCGGQKKKKKVVLHVITANIWLTGIASLYDNVDYMTMACLET